MRLSPNATRRPGARGIALVTVLIVIVLITALIIGFLARAGSERTASANYSASVSTTVLASTAINLVQGQINEATTTTAAGSTTSSLCWASQPGAIRLFNTDGTLNNIYRLYSSNAMTTKNVNDLKNNDVPTQAVWQGSPAVWTDLNEPVAVKGLTDRNGNALTNGTNGYNVYPILDPRDPASAGASTTTYLDAKIDEYGDNWGFSYDNTNVAGFADATPVMPVRWMYVLQNGQVVAPDAGASGRTITISSATPDNPIVGRIAFWTDDETCKVNINTAAGSRSKRTYYGQDPLYGTSLPLPASWSTPHFKIFDERLLFSEDQPVHREYQRYPGHPATTDLFNIFNALGLIGSDYPTSIVANASPQATPSGTSSSLFNLLPRYDDAYSSQGGSRDTTLTSTSAYTMSPKNKRMYTSLGEMIYGTSFDSNNRRIANTTTGAAVVARQQLESGKFFLTAHSRAPEVTLFGTPRIAMWPLEGSTTGTPARTPFDQLIAFCSTTGEVSGSTNATQYPYYFQRYDSTSSTNDLNIARNGQLFSYLQAETSQPIPGYGGTFSAKYAGVGTGSTATERDQILTEMVDYIRSTNMEDHSSLQATKTYQYTNTTGATVGQVLPLKVTSASGGLTQGLGRYNTISEIGIHIICTADGGDGTLTYVPPARNTAVSTVYPTSTVVGSSENAAYVSNLPVAQFLLDHTGTPVGIGLTTGSNTANNATTIPFPANPTLAKNYSDLVAGPGGASELEPGAGTQLGAHQKRLQAALLMEFADPMMGYDSMIAHFDSPPTPAFQVSVTGLSNISIAGATSRFPNRSSSALLTSTKVAGSNGDGILPVMLYRFNNFQNFGGILGFRYPMSYDEPNSNPAQQNTYNGWSGVTPSTPVHPLPYRFVSDPFTVSTLSPTMNFGSTGSTFKIQLQSTAGTTFQTFNVTFPAPTGGLIPIPDLVQWGLSWNGSAAFSNVAHDWWGFDNRIGWLLSASVIGPNTTSPLFGQGCFIRADQAAPAVWSYNNSKASIAIPKFPLVGSTAAQPPSDVVRTLVAKDGDYRLTAAKDTVNATGPGSDFDLGPGYNDVPLKKLGNLFREQGQSLSAPGDDVGGSLVPNATYSVQYAPKFPTTLAISPPTPVVTGSLSDKQRSYDWDSGLPGVADGAHANKPDEGNDYVNNSSPYYNGETAVSNDLSSYFTPNRIVSSPVMFGSLPTGVLENITWRTLRFRPQKTSPPRPAYAELTGPEDYLLLDLFSMPVVEPYAISEPFSTAGKINMNYQIQPFSYITRSTGVRAVLGSELIPQVPKSAAAPDSNGNAYYKGEPSTGTTTGSTPVMVQLPVNVSEKQNGVGGTLLQFVERFTGTGTFMDTSGPTIFKSAAEICDVHLVPRGGDYWPDFADSWYAPNGSYGMVGDNAREHPYADVYPRLTTKSNTYTVHYRVQALRSPHTSATNAQTWDEKYTVAGEYRGSTTIERYVDPTKTGIQDYTTNTFSVPSLDTFYQWRVVANNRFAP